MATGGPAIKMLYSEYALHLLSDKKARLMVAMDPGKVAEAAQLHYLGEET